MPLLLKIQRGRAFADGIRIIQWHFRFFLPEAGIPRYIVLGGNKGAFRNPDKQVDAVGNVLCFLK